MKIAIAQIGTTVGDFNANTAKICDRIERAAAMGASLVVFPELTTTSYPPRDLLERKYFVEANLKALKNIAKSCKKCAALVGFVAKNPSKSGKGLFNSAALLQGGKVKFVQHKALLPTYDVFDEARHFEPARTHKVIKFAGEKIGITICEDVWSKVEISGRHLYHYDPVASLAKEGAKIIINLSASPFNVGKVKVREGLLSKASRQHKLPIVYVNAVGGNDELVFDGRSTVVNAFGQIAHVGRAFEEDFFIVDTQNLKKRTKPVSGEALPVADLYSALKLGLGDYMKKCGFKKVVVGYSGGIDSCVVAALAAEVCGAQNVTGVAMPSPYSSDESVTDAKELAERLGTQFEIVPIGDIYHAYRRSLSKLLGKSEFSDDVTLTDENIQARVRGNILMAISNEKGALVLSTGNKSELAVGYCTLYGDMAGGLALISDVPKVMVWELARYINRAKELIPSRCITKPPSAELRPNQLDTDSLPPYEVLDQILKMYIEEHKSPEEIVRKGFDKTIVDGVVAKIDRNEYKRRQAAPGLKMTSKAFGMGRSFPIAWKS